MRTIDAEKLKDAINSSLNTGRETFPAEIMNGNSDCSNCISCSWYVSGRLCKGFT